MLATLRSYLALKTKSQRQLSLASISGVLGGRYHTGRFTGMPRGRPSREAPQNTIAGMLHFGRHVGNHHLLCFSSFVLARLADGSPYACEKRIAARRGVHTA